VSTLPDCPHEHGRVVLRSGTDASAMDVLDEMKKAGMASCLAYVSGTLTFKVGDERSVALVQGAIGAAAGPPAAAAPIPLEEVKAPQYTGTGEETPPVYTTEPLPPPPESSKTLPPIEEPPPEYGTVGATPENPIQGEETSVSHVADKNMLAVMLTIRFSEATLRAIAKRIDDTAAARRKRYPKMSRKDGARAMYFAHQVTYLVAVARRRIAHKALEMLTRVSEVCPVGDYSTREICLPIEVTEVEGASRLTSAADVDALTKDYKNRRVGHAFHLLQDGAEFSVITCNTCTTDGISVTVLHDVAVLQHGPANAVVTMTEAESSSAELLYLTYKPSSHKRPACHPCMHGGKSPWFEEQFAATRFKARPLLVF